MRVGVVATATSIDLSVSTFSKWTGCWMVVGLSPLHPQDGYEPIFYQVEAPNSNDGIRLMHIFLDPFTCVMGDEVHCVQQESLRATTFHRLLPMRLRQTHQTRHTEWQPHRHQEGAAKAISAGAQQKKAPSLRGRTHRLQDGLLAL